MATKKQQVEDETGIALVDMDPETRREAQEMADLDRAEGGALFKAIEEARSVQGAEVILRRTMPADAAGFCDKIPVGEFDLAMLKSKYGPGTYVIRFSGVGGKFLPGGGTIKIAPLPQAAKTAGWDNLGNFMEAQAARDEERRKEESDRRNKIWELAMVSIPTVLAGFFNRQPQSDVPALIAALKPVPGPSLTDLVTALSSMKTLQGGDSSDPLDRIFKIMEAVKGMSGEAAGETNWTDVVKELVREGLPMAKGALENMASQQRQIQQQPPLQIHPLSPSPQPNPAAIATPVESRPSGVINQSDAASFVPTAGQSGEADMLTLFMPTIREHLAKVTKWASEDRNPEAYAEVFMDELPQMVANYIKPADAILYMQREDWFQKVVEFYPALENYREWCDEFRQELITIITDQIQSTKESDSVNEED